MSIDLNEYVEKVFLRISKGQPSSSVGHYRSAIESTLDAALDILADVVAASPDLAKRALLQKSFSYTLSSGEAALSANPSLLISTIPSTGYVTLTGVTQPLQWLPHRLDLANPPPIADYYFYTILDNKILVRTSTGAIPSATALTLHASFVPLISEVPDELQDEDLIAIGLQLALGIDSQGTLGSTSRAQPEDDS